MPGTDPKKRQSGRRWRAPAIGAVVVALATISLQADSLPNDVNGDGRVNSADCMHIMAAWGTGDPAADVTRDGIVDFRDLWQVLARGRGSRIDRGSTKRTYYR